MSSKLKGRIAVVTGSSRGLGRQVAITLAKEGAQVALTSRSESALRETERMIQDAGGSAVAIPSDVSSIESVERLKQTVEERLGPPTILVNVAGIFGPIQWVKDSDPIAWVETIQINTIGPYLMCRAFIDGMLAARWGRIINFSSAAALHPPGPLNSAYGASKVALNQFTRHLAAEVADSGVTANVIHPGDVRTEMFEKIREDAKKMGPDAKAYQDWVTWMDETGGDDPQKAADLVLKLTSDQFASTTGQFLWIENGLQAPIPSWESPDSGQPWKDSSSD